MKKCEKICQKTGDILNQKNVHFLKNELRGYCTLNVVIKRCLFTESEYNSRKMNIIHGK